MRRNPYLILGVDYGAPNSTANKAFARASRRLRGASDGQFNVEDLTWALQQVEHVNTDPHGSVDYFRVPADPTAYEVTPTQGLMLMPVVPLPRRTGPVSETELSELVAEVLSDCETTMLNELPITASAYGLGIDLGSTPPVGDQLPLMAEALTGERQQAINVMTSEARQYDSQQINESLGKLDSLGLEVPTTLALAMLDSGQCSESVVQRLAQAGGDKAVAERAVSLAATEPGLLSALASSPSAVVRTCVATNPKTPPEILKTLRKDSAPEVASAAKAASPQTTRNVAIAAVIVLLALAVLVFLLRG